MNKQLLQDRYSMINDLCTSIKDRVDSIFDDLLEKDFDITDEEHQAIIQSIKYNIETLERYL